MDNNKRKADSAVGEENPLPTDAATSEEEEEQAEIDNAQSQQTQQIVQTGSITPAKGRHVIHCLTIVGQVEGHYILPPQNKTTKYEHVIPQLVAIQEDPQIEGLIIILNTVGGDVEAGLAIAELVSGMRKPTVSIVLGGGHSIGVPLAVSAQQSFIVPSATMTLHPVRMNGVVLGVPQTLSYFDKMQERIVRFVTENSKVSADTFRNMIMNTGELVMDVGTVLDGQQAVEIGLIDHLGGLADAITCLYSMIDEQKAKKEQETASDTAEEKETSAKAPSRPKASRVEVYQPVMRRRLVKNRRREPFRSAAAVKNDSAVAGVWPPHRLSGPLTGQNIRSGQERRSWDGGAKSYVNPFGDAGPVSD